jgi:TonB family protein
MMPAPYPPNALGDGVSVIEVRVGSTGATGDVRVVQSGGGFDGAALDTAKRWRFRAAQRDGSPVVSFVYLVFGFRQPVSMP